MVLTAKHVIEGGTGQFVRTVAPDKSSYVLERVVRIEYAPQQPAADIAALILDGSAHEWEYFSLIAKPEFELGISIMSYGYPDDRAPRLMFGHIQRTFVHRGDTFRYGQPTNLVCHHFEDKVGHRCS